MQAHIFFGEIGGKGGSSLARLIASFTSIFVTGCKFASVLVSTSTFQAKIEQNLQKTRRGILHTPAALFLRN